MNKTSIFIDKANKIHNFKYDYSKVNYINSKTKVEIICKEHNSSFFIQPNSHLNKVGCPICNGGVKFTLEEFIQKANLIHQNKYDYSKSIYVNSKTKIEIICSNHGSFFQTPAAHLNNQKCPKCSNNFKSSTEKFIEKADIIHNNLYNYDKSVYIDNKSKIIIECEKHGDFLQIPKDHLKGHGCYKCNNSKGVIQITNILKRLNINFIQEKTFDDCYHIKKLPFDFYLNDFNILIEFDGKQHFEPVEMFGGLNEYLKLKINDEIKNNYCLNNIIKLIRIKYNQPKQMIDLENYLITIL